jgi:hypothetical protein|tara:strand:+ start:811 stop:3612 length:2802 start_codon:yes stop_codon:yes gene_type:complete
VGIMCVTESKLTDDIRDAEVSIPNFYVYREDRTPKSKSGGSAIYVRKDFNVSKLDWFNGSESIALKINSQSFEIYIICIYRSPSLRTIDENEKLLTQLANVPIDCDKNIVIVGDVNLPNVDWKRGIVKKPENSNDKYLNMQSEFLDLFISKGFVWFVENEITRVRMVNNILQQSTLDQVLSNNDSLINHVDIQAPLGASDHLGLMVELNVKLNLDFISTKHKNWYKVSEDFVNTHAENIDWSCSDTEIGVESMWDELHQKMLSISDKVPETTIKTNKQGNILEKLPWDSSKLVRKRKEKDKAWRAFEDNPHMNNFQIAHYKQGQYSNIELKEKLKYEKKIITGLKKNTKPFFRYLKSKNKVRKTVKELTRSDGTSGKSPEETAGILLDFFQSVFKSESFGPLQEDCYKSNQVLSDVMEKLNINESDVKKLLLNLKENKSMGPDNVHPKLLKLLAANDGFVKSLTSLLNKCVEGECIPSMWKSALVVPIHKKGSVHLPENYRPVSLTCIICKLYEHFIRKHILTYVIDIITDKQHGFVPGKSCLSNLLETIDKANEFMSDGNCLDLLYFDFSKAFDTVSHYRLLIKLEAMGFSTNMLNIIRDFLGDRIMKVKVGDTVSQAKPVMSGVPQGSVLGPLLFLLFINDLPERIKNEIKIFADDVKMVADPKNYHSIQEDLEELGKWESVWLLMFNVEKCKVLQVGKTNPKNNYMFLGSELEKCNSEKDLGVLFNEKFNFSDHIYASISKAKASLAWFERNTLSRDPYVMKTAYKSLIRHNVEYCCQVWSPKRRHGNWKTILDIEAVQRSFTRLINGMSDLNYEQRLKSLGMTTLFERRMRGDLIETFKILNGFNNYGSDFFNLSERTNNLVSRPKKLTNIDFLGERVMHYWNKLPEHVKDKNSVNGFKNGLDKFRTNGINNGLTGQFWELSKDIFSRI